NTGSLTKLTYKGDAVITKDLIPNFLRPATDNDRRGWKPQNKLKYWYNPVELVSFRTKKEHAAVVVESNYAMPGDSAKIEVLYRIYGSGVAEVSYALKANTTLPNIPKVGMSLGVDPSLEQIAYYGLRPLENYLDKGYGADSGVYSYLLGECIEDSVYPQENGKRIQVRQFTLQNQKVGSRGQAKQPREMSAWLYEQSQIESTKQWYKLKIEEKNPVH